MCTPKMHPGTKKSKYDDRKQSLINQDKNKSNNAH